MMLIMDDQVRRALDKVPGWRASECTVAPLHGGMTNRNYKVMRHGEAFVLRIGGENTGLLGIDRRNEFRASTVAASAGVGAEVICFLPDESAFVSRFVAGTPVDAEAASRPDMLRRIVDSLHHIHDGLPFPGTFLAPEVVRSYHRLALERGVTFPAFLPEVLEAMGRIEAAMGPPRRLCPCHNDLLAANFLDDGKTVRILDWEYAAMGDVFFDLGNFAVNQRLGPERRQLLVDFYLGRPGTPAELARLELMRLLSDLREAFWGYLQSGVSKLAFDFRHYGLEHLERFLKNVRSPEVPRWLEEVRGTGARRSTE